MKRRIKMKKRLSTIMAIVAALSMLFIAGPVMADDIDTHDGTTMSGTVPFCANWALTEPDVTPFTDVTQAIYEANEIVVTDLIQITDFDCNTKFKITATKSAWTLPDNYLTAGAKKDDGSDSDLLLMVDNVTAGYTTDGLAALGSYGSYTAIAITTGSDIIGGGAVGENLGHGVENAVCDVNAKILMDWAKDIVGAYSITTTLTITEVTE